MASGLDESRQPERRGRGLLAAIAALVFVVALGIAVTLLVVRYAERTLGSRSAEETVSGVGREILVMQPPGGLLEVGETVTHIRVPATYRSTRSRTWLISSVKSPQCSRKRHRAAPTAGCNVKPRERR